GRAGPEVVAGHKDGGPGELLLVQDEIAVVPPFAEQARAEPGPLHPLQPVGGDDLVGVDVGSVQGHGPTGDHLDGFHQLSSSGVAKGPATEVAAATAGETRWVRPPRPCRPSKFRLEVEAARSPGASLSGFMARHIEQPGSLQSKPASVNTRSRPSASAWALTRWDPGTTSARIPGRTVRPSRTPAAARRSSMRPLVHH